MSKGGGYAREGEGVITCGVVCDVACDVVCG